MSDEDIYYDGPVPEEEYGIIEGQESLVLTETPVATPADEPAVIEVAIPTDTEGDKASSFYRRLNAVRCKLKAPKSAFNSYGGYYYRSCEDILEGLKPLLDEYDLTLTLTDDVVLISDRFYLKATASVLDVESDAHLETTAFAREPESRKGSDQSQVTGSCSSYARKYALNALFLIDDTKDPDVPAKQEAKKPPANGPFVARCKSCGRQYTFNDAEQYNGFIANPGCCPNPQWEVS